MSSNKSLFFIKNDNGILNSQSAFPGSNISIRISLSLNLTKFVDYEHMFWYNLFRNTLTVECLPPKGGGEMTKKDFLIFALIIIIILLILLLFK